jgi:hypothetical protein
MVDLSHLILLDWLTLLELVLVLFSHRLLLILVAYHWNGLGVISPQGQILLLSLLVGLLRLLPSNIAHALLWQVHLLKCLLALCGLFRLANFLED